MIHFACKNCEKVFERPDETAGTLVFCDCGTGNRVPWESTALDPPAEAGEEIPSADPSADGGVPAAERDRPLRWRLARRFERDIPERDPAFCFNHQDRPTQSTCAACGEAFCASCVLSVQGQALCGPCKNFRIRSLQRPPQFSIFALFSLLLGLFTGPAGLFCVSLSAGMQSAVPSFAGLVLPLMALILGAKALRDIETKPRMSGRSIAIAGMVSGLVAAFLTAVWAVLVEKQLE